MFRWRRQSADGLFAVGVKAFDSSRFSEAAIAWKDAAMRGHAEAAARLADMFITGNGVLRSLPDAKHWYGVAAEGGIARAQVRFAELCLSAGGGSGPGSISGALAALCPHGVSLEPDEEMARHWARVAAKQGDAAGQALAGYLLASGRGGEADYQQAAYWYRLAAEKGQARAQLGLGILLAGTQLGDPSYGEAFEWFRKAAEQGNGTAMYYLGVFYQQGLGRPSDKSVAVAHYRRAADVGCIEGQRCLGKAYLAGEGIDRDVISAEAWLRKAARSGDADAMASLGDLYANESASNAQALEWYQAAADRGHKAARLLIDRISARQQRGTASQVPGPAARDDVPRLVQNGR